MQSPATEKDDPIARLARLGSKDRRAILQQLSQEERSRIELALRERERNEAVERERQQRIDRQFLGYSPWLASLIEASQHAVPDGLTETASRALWDIHAEQVASRAPAVRPGWLGQLDRLADWFAPIRKGGQ